LVSGFNILETEELDLMIIGDFIGDGFESNDNLKKCPKSSSVGTLLCHK